MCRWWLEGLKKWLILSSSSCSLNRQNLGLYLTDAVPHIKSRFSVVVQLSEPIFIIFFANFLSFLCSFRLTKKQFNLINVSTQWIIEEMASWQQKLIANIKTWGEMHSEELFATEIPDGITRKLLGGTKALLLTRKVIKERFKNWAKDLVWKDLKKSFRISRIQFFSILKQMALFSCAWKKVPNGTSRAGNQPSSHNSKPFFDHFQTVSIEIGFPVNEIAFHAIRFSHANF